MGFMTAPIVTAGWRDRMGVCPCRWSALGTQGNTEHQLERMERSYSAKTILALRVMSGRFGVKM